MPTVPATNAQNLLLNSPVTAENLKLFGKSATTVSVVEKDGHQVYKLVVSGSSNAGAYFKGNIDYYNLVKDRSYTFSFWVLTNKDKTYSSGSLGHIQAVNNNSDKVGNDNLHQHTTPVYSTNTIKANTWTKVWCTFKATSNSYFRPYFWYLNAGDEIYIYDMMLNEGDTPLPYIPAPEDLGWSTDTLVPTQEQRYLWKFEYIYYSDGSVEVTSPINISIAGADGTNGQTSHVHFAFADNATGGGFSLTTPKEYMGWYVDFTEADSTDPTKYRWTKWKGSDGGQGIPGKPGADGKTPYIHFAYADDDEGTNFSLTDKNQQYQGYYSDYTEADSTDYRKYKWVDRLANVQAGVRNLFLNSLFKRDLHAKYSTYELMDNITQTQGQLAATIDTTTKYLNSNSLKIVSTYDGTPKNQKITFITGGDTRTGAVDEMSNKSVMMSFYAKSTVENTVFRARAGYRSETQVLSIGTEWKYYSFQLIKPLPTNATNEVIMHIETKATIWIVRPKVEIGTLSTDYIEAPEDTQSDIDSKADQTLTQEQLNALEAKRLQMETEMKALATLQQVSELETFINNLKKEDLDGRQKIIEITKAIEERVKDIEPIMEYSQKLKFMDTYITQGNGGMVIGANDSATKVVVTPDRISFQSGGSEVAYISQRMLHIDNGVFTMSLQLGHYITRAHPKNEFVNATYFVK